MALNDIFFTCFVIGAFWAFFSLLAGSLHIGHWHAGDASHHLGASQRGHSIHAHIPDWLGSLLNPNCVAVFLAWFGGAGYLLTKYSGLAFWLNLTFALTLGVLAAAMLARFLRWLMRHEHIMNPADYDMVGVLGRVSSTIRADGVGEIIYLHHGARRSFCAKSESKTTIERGEEVIVTHLEKGIALVRTWEAMSRQAQDREPEKIA